MVGLPDGEKNEDMYNRLDTISACNKRTDRRTEDRRTSCHLGIVRAMHTRRAVKICSRVDPTGSAILRKPGNGRACAVCRLCKTISHW